MAETQRNYAQTADQAAIVDQGLRTFMLRVYNLMASGVLLSGIVAYAVANSSLQSMFYATAANGGLSLTLLGWAAILSPIAFVLVLSAGINRLSYGSAQAVFWAFAAVMGVSVAQIFLVFTGASVARVFFITAATFGAMSLYGYTTKADLSRFGSFLMMGLLGVVIASVVNIFLASSALQFALSIIGVLVFVGLTAYDTQRIKESYVEGHDHETAGKLALMGALTLYLDFINLFMLLMQLFGQKRD